MKECTKYSRHVDIAARTVPTGKKPLEKYHTMKTSTKSTTCNPQNSENIENTTITINNRAITAQKENKMTNIQKQIVTLSASLGILCRPFQTVFCGCNGSVFQKTDEKGTVSCGFCGSTVHQFTE